MWAAAVRANFVILNSSVAIYASTPTYSSLIVSKWGNFGSSVTASGGFYGALTGNAQTATTATNLTATATSGDSAITAINAGSSTINWARVSKTGSNLTDLVTRDHASLTSIGTNTHAAIDTHLAATTAHSATAANTPSRIVLRDGTGNFSAGTITAKLTGNADTATTATNVANSDAGGQTVITAINSATSGQVNWARVNKTGSNLTDLVTRNHTALSSIGTNTHATIDTHLAATGAVHGATAANTASQIVLRDASGNFTAGTITAYHVGNTSGNSGTATTATNLAGGALGNIPYQSAAGGTSFIAPGTLGYVLTGAGSAIPTWTQTASANTASTLVIRDASGNFTAGTVAGARFNATTALQFSGVDTLSVPGTRNVLLGASAGGAGSTDSTYVGYNAGAGDAGTNNTYVGSSAGLSANNATFNTAVGFEAGKNIGAAATQNVFVGAYAGRGSAATLTGGNNIVMGGGSGSSIQGTASDNVLIGDAAGYYVTTGHNNVVIGRGDSSTNLSTGDNNILIGHNLNAPSVAVSSTVNIGNAIQGGLLAGTTITFTPVVSAPYFIGNGSQLTGISGGASVSTFTYTFHSGGDIFLSSAATTGTGANNPFPNVGLSHVIEDSTWTITGVRCYTLYGSTQAASTFNISITTGTTLTKTFNFLFTSDISVAANSTYSAWAVPDDATGKAMMAYVPAAIGMHVTSVPASGTLPQEYGCVVRYWRKL